jgi:hypothetical protein
MLASWANTTLNDIAAELTASLPVDGSKGMTGQLLLPNGTKAAPSLTFNSDSDTGLYRVSANILGVSAANTLVQQFEATKITHFNVDHRYQPTLTSWPGSPAKGPVLYDGAAEQYLFSFMKETIFTANGTFTPISGCRTIEIHCTGGGGGSGGIEIINATDAEMTGGGGGGAYSYAWVAPDDMESHFHVTVGAAGAAGAVGADGGDGGFSQVEGGDTLTVFAKANGGEGSPSIPTTGCYVDALGGVQWASCWGGGCTTTGAVGLIKIAGEYGGGGNLTYDTALVDPSCFQNYGGKAAGPHGGYGGTGSFTDGTGAIAGMDYGGGAGGLTVAWTALGAGQVGSAGGAGIVVIREYF